MTQEKTDLEHTRKLILQHGLPEVVVILLNFEDNGLAEIILEEGRTYLLDSVNQFAHFLVQDWVEILWLVSCIDMFKYDWLQRRNLFLLGRQIIAFFKAEKCEENCEQQTGQDHPAHHAHISLFIAIYRLQRFKYCLFFSLESGEFNLTALLLSDRKLRLFLIWLAFGGVFLLAAAWAGLKVRKFLLVLQLRLRVECLAVRLDLRIIDD